MGGTCNSSTPCATADQNLTPWHRTYLFLQTFEQTLGAFSPLRLALCPRLNCWWLFLHRSIYTCVCEACVRWTQLVHTFRLRPLRGQHAGSLKPGPGLKLISLPRVKVPDNYLSSLSSIQLLQQLISELDSNEVDANNTYETSIILQELPIYTKKKKSFRKSKPW